MSRAGAILGSALFFVIAPFTLTVLVSLWLTGWRMQPPFGGLPLLRVIGALLAIAGAVPLIESFRRFAVEGLGTPAPIAPPQRLIVAGFYRYVRNPMYVGVVTVILGEALILGDVRLLTYAAIVWFGFHIFVLAYEEPTLRDSYGAEYDMFRHNVPRWIPRFTPWTAIEDWRRERRESG
jgi:protein-S-isoprenylcysteine O-methyltransferase Ste14